MDGTCLAFHTSRGDPRKLSKTHGRLVKVTRYDACFHMVLGAHDYMLRGVVPMHYMVKLSL